MKPSPSRLNVILFDLGDTLIYFDEPDRAKIFAEAHRALLGSLQSAGLQVGNDFLDEFNRRMNAYYRERDTEFIEHTTYYVLGATLSDWGLGSTPDAIVRCALVAFHRVTQSHWTPEDDSLPTLQNLRTMGYRMGLVSNAADDANTQVLVDKVGIRALMDVIVSSAALGVRKPNPKIFRYALEKMATTPENAAMVGDTLGADILGARNAGIYGIWLSRRGDTPANRAHRDTIIPDATISTLSELPELMERINFSHRR